MTTAIAGYPALKNICDTQFPSTGQAGYLTLLSGALSLNLPATGNPATGEITATGHGLVTSSRVRFGGTPPNPLFVDRDYWVIVTSPNTFKVSPTAEDAALGNAQSFYDAGNNCLLNEQRLSSSDELSVLLNKEVQHPAWPQRSIIDNLGAAFPAISEPVAQKPARAVLVPNADPAPMEFRHILLLMGPATSATIGDSSNVQAYYLSDEGVNWTVAQGETKSITLQFRARQA